MDGGCWKSVRGRGPVPLDLILLRQSGGRTPHRAIFRGAQQAVAPHREHCPPASRLPNIRRPARDSGWFTSSAPCSTS